MTYDTLDNQSTSDGGAQAGKLLANRYQVIRKLGEGGMGMVYLAEDTELQTRVAIKFVPPVLAGNPRAVKNLKREAVTAMQLSHENIVRLHDLHADGHQKFLVMEYIDGKTLETLLAEKPDDRLGFAETVSLARQIGAALDYAHQRHILHRDLKPSNIMVAATGEVKLLDFGIARELKDSYTRLTGHETSGTLPYMSPEQLRGQPPSSGMDVYSLAAVLYECLCGHAPFYTGDVRHQILEEPVQPLEDPRAAGVMQALAKNPEDRPDSGRALVALLDAPRVKQKKEKRGTPAVGRRGASLLLTVLLIGLGVYAFMNINTDGTPPAGRVGNGPLAFDDRPISEEPNFAHGIPIPELLSDTVDKPTKGGVRVEAITLPAKPVSGAGDMDSVSQTKAGGERPGEPVSVAPVKGNHKEVVEGSLTGQTRTNTMGMTLVYIPAGSFRMGSPETEVGRDKDEGPAHQVTITRAYWMGQTEVTVGHFRAFVTHTDYVTEAQRQGGARDVAGESDKDPQLTWENPRFWQTDREPVVCVSWNDAQAFCAWLSKIEDAVYRLPTEAQWEYACRARTASAFQWGPHPDQGSGWCNAADLTAKHTYPSRATFNWHDGLTYTGSVGKRRPNIWNLYDMHGNVWEWVQDRYFENYYTATPITNPSGPRSGGMRVMRGGSWYSKPESSRSASRHWDRPTAAVNDIGFRVIMEVD